MDAREGLGQGVEIAVWHRLLDRGFQLQADRPRAGPGETSSGRSRKCATSHFNYIIYKLYTCNIYAEGSHVKNVCRLTAELF